MGWEAGNFFSWLVGGSSDADFVARRTKKMWWVACGVKESLTRINLCICEELRTYFTRNSVGQTLALHDARFWFCLRHDHDCQPRRKEGRMYYYKVKASGEEELIFTSFVKGYEHTYQR